MTYRPTLYASLDKGWMGAQAGWTQQTRGREHPPSSNDQERTFDGLGGRDGRESRDGGRPSINCEALLC